VEGAAPLPDLTPQRHPDRSVHQGGMGLLWLLVVVVLVLGAAALLKYLLSGRRRDGPRGE
jgi:hypothetical protein